MDHLEVIKAEQAASTALVQSLRQQILLETEDKRRIEETLRATEVILSARTQETEKIKKSMDAENAKNMALYGKMAIDKRALEERTQQLAAEVAASNDRCVSLRAMNEELLQMLEQNVPAEA